MALASRPGQPAPVEEVVDLQHEEVVDLQHAAPPSSRPALEIHDLAQLIAEVDAAPAPRHLLRPIWPAGDHGMVSAEDKAGKTWLISDAAVSVASGTAWLGIYDVDAPGPVLLFVGEGGKRKIVRRLRAICEAKRVRAEDLRIRVCMRVPHLTDELAMVLVEEEIASHHPVLVIVDPLYLAARGARGSDLYEMGEHLERVQILAQRYGAALMISHHWNKTGEGRGAKRMTGVGPSAWGRVLVSAAVINRHTDDDTGKTTVTLELDFQGDEIPETTTRIVRRVWAEDRDDLASPLHYEVSRVEAIATTDDELSGLRPSAVRVLAVLDSRDDWWTVVAIGDELAKEGSPLRARTIQVALGQLVEVGRAVAKDVPNGITGQWRTTRAHLAETEAGNAA